MKHVHCVQYALVYHVKNGHSVQYMSVKRVLYMSVKHESLCPIHVSEAQSLKKALLQFPLTCIGPRNHLTDDYYKKDEDKAEFGMETRFLKFHVKVHHSPKILQ